MGRALAIWLQTSVPADGPRPVHACARRNTLPPGQRVPLDSCRVGAARLEGHWKNDTTVTPGFEALYVYYTPSPTSPPLPTPLVDIVSTIFSVVLIYR